MTERARSFGSVAADYDRHRPGYPAAAVEWALAPAPGPVVLDLGAGTGKLTALAAARPGATVVAVEPDPAMLGQLRSRFPEVDARLGTAEQIPLPDGEVDAVVVGQAWHWFDRDAAAAELARVLRPGGVVSVVWNLEDGSVPWVAGLNKAMGSNERFAAYSDAGDHPRGAAFGPPERRRFPNPFPLTTDRLIATAATHSWAIVAEPADRDAAFARARAYLAECPETSGGSFTFPLVTDVVRTLRR